MTQAPTKKPGNPPESYCLGKQRFDSYPIASRAAGRRPGRSPYRCPHCGGWHVGSHTGRAARKPTHHIKQEGLCRRS